jgi:gliding motility-associated-like protein
MFYDSGQVAAHPLTTTVGSGVTIGTPGASVTNWTYDAINGFAQPPTGTFNADTTRYDSTGRFTILHNEQGIALQEYTGFHNIAFDKSFKPDILSSANVLGPDTFQLCLGDFATFSSSIFGDTTRWEFNGAITNPGNVQFVPSTQFNVSGFFMVQLFLITDCCGDTPIDTAYIYVDPVPAVTGSGPEVICAGGNVNLAVFGLSPNDTVIWTPAINLGIISLDSANVSPTVTRTYKASVYTIITSGSQTRLSCPVALPYDITINPLPNPVMSSTNVVCSNDGTATATPPAGLYDFVWSDGSITSSAASSTINNLPTGSYCVTVTDLSSGCIDTGCIFVNPAVNLPALNVSTTPITCFGDNDGVATISTTGGTTTAVGYTYAISPAVPVVPNPSLTPVTLTGLAPGNYSVTSTDEIGCVTTLNFDITTPQPLILNVIDTLNPVCQSTFDGRIEVEGQGGTGLLTYSWSNGVVTADSGILSGIDTGLYCVTVVDDNNCSAVFCHTLRPQQVLSTSLAVSAIPCNGGTACITVNAVGGSNAYAYDWSGPVAPTPFSTGNDVSCGFPASTSLYTVLITDSTFSCTTTASVSITEPSALSATIASQTDVNCFGDSTGIASAGASGGTPGYSYLWNYGTNETNVALDSLPDGVYTVTVTDATGVCTTTETVTITEPATAVDVTAAISSNFNGQQVSCFGATDGEATATASGGTPASTGYDFQWDANAANQNTPIAVGLSVANNPYVVVVTDSLNCTDTDTIAFAQPSAVTATVSSSISVSCFGDSSGQATIAASGGTAPYNFLWSDGQSTLTGVGLQVANNPYCVTVTDNNGCSDVLCFNIAQPAAPITSSISVIADPSCFGGSDGSVFATASGGTGITTYLWGGGLATGQTNDTITGLPDGQYCVTISDANLCTTVECVTLTQPSQVTATISATQAIDCFGDSSGTATVSGSGGTLPGYGITWDNGQSTVQATGLVANIPHCVTITDNNGCPASTCITLTQSASAITVGATVISNYNGADLSCAGATDACVQANAANGTPFAVGDAYTYNWAPSASNDDSLCAVGAGVYAVTVTDSLGCQASATVTVGSPTALTASIISTTNVLCFGDSTGCADVATAGGTGTVTYLWPDGLTTAQNCNLFNGSHTVTVSDANGCTVTATAIINQPALPLTLASVVVDSTVKCNAGNDGGITANPSGGSGSYNFSWSNSATTATLTGLTQGTYCVTLTDVPNGCIDTACIQMTQPSAVTATITSQVNVNCFGAATGSATAAGSGGTALNPYTFVWDANAAGQSTATATGLIAGLQYCVTVSDDNGCFDVVCVTLTQPSAILSTTAAVAVNPAYNGSDVSCTGASDGMVVAAGIDGAGGYSYDWGSGNSNDTLSNVAAGVYCVTVTDANACIATACATVTDPVALTTSINAIDVTNINCAGDSTGTALVTVTGGNLTVPYAYQWDNGLTTQQGTNLLAGQQCVSVTDANGCISVACVSITEPASTIVIAGITVDSNVSCNGLSDGGATAVITGGTPALGGYDFAWSGNGSTGQTTASITGLAAGAHCLIVTDSLLCVDTLCVTISEPVSVSANIDLSTAVNINCFGDSTGQATATATGGSGVYTFLWDANANNQNTATATGLQAGISYCVTVTDNNGCVSDSACVTLTQPASAINASAVELTQVSCNAGADGAVQVTASGGTAAGSAYTFLWGTNAGSVTTPTVNGLSVANGPYCVTATDALGCTDTSCATLTEPLILNVTTASITNILCNGDSLGEITLAVTGGTAGTGYTYQWDAAADSATTQVVVGLPAGVFCATVNDANNCSASVCVTLTEPTTAVDVTATVNSNFNGSAIQCFGDSSGTALAVATGGAPGVGGYTFSWSLTSQTTALATGLPDGTFVVTAIDSVGCLDTAIVTLVDPTQVVASTTINNTVSCLGGCDGEATVSAVGGVAGYTVLWDAAAANQTTATATGLCQGLYGVTISDANGCSSSATVNITQPSTAVTASALVTSSYNGQDISCNNAFDGIACGSAVGGTPDYTYLWGGGVASGATTQCVSGLNAGTYSVTVSDSLGCSAFNTVTLTEPSAVTPSAISTVDVSCFGDSTGAATVQGIGGLAPYNFQWEAAADSQQTATATGLAAGSYLVTVLDANGCQGVDVVVVGQPSGALNVTTSVLSSFPGGTAMQCFGDSSGQATVNVSGGSPIYNIIWDIGSQTTNTITGLSDGTYCVTVTDAQGCSDTACVTLVQPLLLTATTTSDSALCNGGNTGSATVVASGGTGAGSYLYQWDASALGQNTATANGLAAGLYNVTVIDANGCQTVVAATVNQPATGVNVGLVITSNYNGQDVSCNGAIDAIVNASATGGSVVGNYNYVWSNGTVDNPLDTVGAGQHCVIVTDDNGCSATDCITVTQPSAITATIVASTSVTCFNTCTGSATVAGAGGTAIPGYSYQWDTAAGSQTTAVAIGLCVGSYNVTVVDGNGCFAVASVIITQPTAPLTTALNVTSNYNGQQLSCAGASDAEITATVTGGDGSYTISWNNSSSTTNVAAALSAAANPHCVFIVDGLGCTDTACINLVPPTAVTCTIVATTPISCNGGSNGSATVNPGGGTGGFSFIWDDGQTTATAVGLSAGPICVTITDANGCAATACTNLSDPAALSLTATINSNYNGSNVSCAGACDGIVFATALGGTQPYQSYTWSTSGAGITDTITLACAGTVDVTVTDANGCIAVATTVTLTEPSAITATITASADASCNGQCDGTATVTAAGGTLTTGYTFLWSASAGAQTTASATGLCSGTHNVTVTDNNNCNAVTSVFIDQPLLGVSATAVVSSNFNAADVSCFGACDGEATATGAGGTLISGYTFQWDIAAAAQTTSIASGLCAGVYSVTVSDNGGCSNVANVTLTDPSQLSTTIVSTVSVSCGGGNDGQATVSASGGTLTTGYTYLWDASANGQTTTTATGLPGDVGINVSVTDNNGCVSVATVTITQPANALFVNPVVISDFNGQAISCNGACDAIVAVQTAGGIPGYSINWNTAATTDTLSNLCPGTYVVTVTDNGNCTIVDSVVVTEPVVLSASISSQNNVSCTGGNDACVTIQGAGGTAGYSYSIVSGVTQANNGLFCNLTAGNYSVTVSDLNFCTTTVSVTITEPTALPTVTAAVSSDYLGQDISCFGACDADVTATATAGTAPYTYNWSMTTQNTATVTGICAGVFSVIITDSLGCTASASVTVVEPTQLVGQLTATTDVACFGDSTGTASFSASGGIAPYTYNNGLSSTTTLSTTATLLNIPAGAYLTTITDGNGCSVLVPFAITSPPVLTNTASVTSSYANGTVISCNGLCDGAATAVGTGGNPGSTYNFLWSASANSQTSFTATGLCAGTHSVTITDQNGCSAIDSVTLNEPIQLAATSSGTGIDCFGGTTGSVQVNAVTGTGTPNYTYTLGSVTNSTGLFSNLGIGTYCVTITDGNNCSIVECVTLSQNTLVVASAFVSSNYNGAQTSCQNSSDGEATVNVTGGVAPYAFLWSTGASNQTSQTAVGLAAGTYVVTVTDVFGCNDTDTVIIVSPDSVILDVIDTVHITCFGQPTGSFTVAASGGVGPYTYSFDGGVTFTNQVQYTNLPANSVGSGYCVIVQDANGCQTTTCVTINEPTQLQGLADSITMVSCFGGADGVIAVSGVGGTPPYGYSFNGGLSTSTNVFNGLIAGNYTVVITDSEACQTTMSNLIVTQPPVLILTVDTTRNPSCTGDCDGVIQVTASQGSGGFEYSIDGINYQATGNFTNLCAGGYTLFVRDVQGCITSIPVTLSQPTFVLANATVTSDYNGFDVTCNTACDGAATATPSGGTSFSTGLYLYQWSVLGSTTQSVTGLCANTLYTVTVIDANGCTDVDSVILTEPTPVDANYVQVTNESCFGNDGVIAVTAVIGSGVGPYTYDIGTGSSASGTFTGLTGTAVGTPYSVTITDANNCTTVLDTFLTLPAVLDITDISVTSNFNGQDISCFGAADGAATIAHTGGNAPISYLWDISTGAQTTITANGLRAGTYAVTITDAAGCTADTSIVLTQPTPLIMSAQVDSSAGCNGASGGQISATPSGSVPAYSYAIDSTGAGVPTVFGTDSLWSNLSAGTYTVYVQDFNGCGPVSQLLTIGDDAPITTITSVLTPFNGQAIACNGDSTATATVASTGGSVGIHFIYQWDTNAASQTGTTATGLAAGVYFVTITDTVSTCTDIAQVTVNEPSLVSVNIDTVVNVDCYGQATGAVQVSGLGGTPSYTYSIDYPASQSPLGTFVGLPEGNYSITTTDANTCTATVTVSITDPDSLAIDLDTVNVSCFGLSDGAITAVVSGGTPFSTGYGYSVTWSPAASGAIDTLASLTAGSYTMTVQDARGCVATATAAVIEPTPIVVATDSLVPATCADTNGLLVLTASGGPSQLNGTLNNFEYSIDGGLTFQSSPVFNNLASGFYDIVVRDLGYTQCIGVYAVDLGSNSNITGTVDVSNESCFGYADGTASVFTSSTAGGYTYEWFTSVSSTVISTDQTATGLDGNIVPNTTGGLDTNFIYIVQVTDADGCVYTDSAYIESPDSLVVTASLVADVSCYGGADGMLNATVSGRDSLEVDYLWSNGATTAMSTGFTATPPDTIYTITITDSVGCNASDDIVISQPELPLAAFMTGSTVSCTDSTDGVITVDLIGGGTLPYLYSYSVVGPYGSDAILTQGLGAGIYTVYVQDGNGCTDSVENIVIRDTLDYIVTAFQDATINMGETVDLYGTVNNSDVDSSLVSWSMLDPNTGIISSLFTGTAALEGFTPDTFYTDMQFILALNNGCGDTSVVEILVNQEQTVYIPNGFSPNGDGYNDIFTVYGSTDVEKVKTFMVFDRWGELVHLGQDFEPGSTDPVNGWDGKFRGKPMNPTVLVYYAEIILVNGETVIRKGDVTLVK